MDHGQHRAIGNFIWNIADDVLRDVYVRGKYRDVILPMTVIRRLDCVLEPTKAAVLEMDARLDAMEVTSKDGGLRNASNGLETAFEETARAQGSRWTARQEKAIREALCVRDEAADAILVRSKAVQAGADREQDALIGKIHTDVGGHVFVNEYEEGLLREIVGTSR